MHLYNAKAEAETDHVEPLLVGTGPDLQVISKWGAAWAAALHLADDDTPGEQLGLRSR